LKQTLGQASTALGVFSQWARRTVGGPLGKLATRIKLPTPAVHGTLEIAFVPSDLMRLDDLALPHCFA
jgi:hypothetical protein